MKQEEIAKALTKWFNDEKICSGLPHCAIEECDLCMNCFDELCDALGCVYKYNKVIVKK